jgi:flagellin
MSLGVLNNLSAMYAENNLNNSNSSLNTVLQQLSSGSKINSGADDAAGLSLVDGLQANSMALTQSQTNATEGVGLLTVADGALSQVTNLLNRAVTLATEASNGTLNSSQDTAANQEYQSILSEVSNIGSTTTYNGNTVFGSNTNIFTGDSSAVGSSIDSLNIRSLSSSNLGDTDGAMAYSNGANNVFINLSNGGNNASASDSLGAASATTTINVGYLTTGASGAAVSATAAISVGAGTNYSNTAQGLISAINNAGLGLNASFSTATEAGTAAVASAESAGGSGSDTGIEISATGIGTGTNGVGVVGALSQDAGQTLSGTLNIVGSDGSSHNITLGTANSTDNLANLANAINADAYGITASVNQAGTQLTFTSASSAVSVSGTNVAENTAASTSNATVLGSSLGSVTVGAASDTLQGSLNVVSGVDGSSSTIALGTAGSTDTLANLAASFTGTGANAGLGITATLSNNGTTLTFTKSSGDANTPSMTGSNVVDAATPTITTSSTLGSLSLASAGDKLAASGDLNIISGITGVAVTPLALGTAGSTDTLANLANTINNGGYGISAALDTTGTVLTFTANSGNAYTATISGSGTITDDTTPTSAATFTAGGTNIDSISVAGAGDTISTGSAANLVITGTPSGGSTTSDTIALGGGQTLSQIMTTVNTANDTGIRASLSQDGKTLTFTAMSGTTATGVTLSASTIVDNEAAVDTNASVVAQNGALGSLSVLNASNTLTGTLNVTEGLDTSETGTALSVSGLTLAQIADNFDDAKTYSSSTPTDWSAYGITATLDAAGTAITFTQASGDKGLAAISTAATAPLAETPVIDQGSTLGSLSVNAAADTLGGTLNLTNGITGTAGTLTLGTAGTTDTLANLASTINAGGYGITATANLAGTTLTFTQSSGSDTAAVSNSGSISDTTAAVNNSAVSVVSNVLTAANGVDTLTGTLQVTPNGGSVGAYNFTGQTLAQIASSFNSPAGANYGSGITAAISGADSNILTFTPSGTAAISGTGIADYTPASTANQAVATGTIVNTLVAAGSGDLISGSFQYHSGNAAGTSLTTYTLTAGQTIQEIADDFNNVAGGNATDKTALGALGITASVNTAAIGTLGQTGYEAAGTVLTLTQTSGDTGQANLVTGAGTLVDQVSAADAAQADAGIVAGTGHANTLAVTTAGNTLTGTLKITEGADTNATTSTLNLAGQTLAQIAADFNTSTGTVNLSNLGITAVLNNSTAASATSIAFIADPGDTGAANANVTALTAVVQQAAAVGSTVTTATGTMLDTLSVNSASDKLGGTLSLTSGLTGVAAPTLTLGTAGTTDTLANLASTINSGGYYGITASLNAAKTELTFTQTAGDGFAAGVSGTSVTDSGSISLVNNASLGSLTANTSADTLTGTFTGVGADGATAYTLNFNNKTLAEVEAAVNSDSALGITATLDKTGTGLSFTATTGDAGNPTIGNYGNIYDTTGSTQTAISLADTPTTGTANSSTLGSLSVASNDTLSGSLVIGGHTINIGASDNSAATLASTISQGNYGVTASYDATSGQLTFTSPNSALSVNSSALTETAPGTTTPVAVGSLSGGFTSSSYYSVGITGSVTDTSTLGGTANIGIAANSNGTGKTATISYTDGAGQSLAATDLSNQADAEAALTDLNKAITDVAGQDGYVGAQINTLNAVSQVLSTQQDNVVSAQNAVQATDYASATSNMSKYEILSQTGISALAQANSVQQEVTKLLQ